MVSSGVRVLTILRRPILELEQPLCSEMLTGFNAVAIQSHPLSTSHQPSTLSLQPLDEQPLPS